MSALTTLVAPFLAQVASGEIEVYNEFSLQHELGLFLRQSSPGFKIRFERNVGYYFPSKASFVKREIDLTIVSDDNKLNWAIELKYPRNGQYPEQMFSFCKDILFAEQLKLAGFANAGLLIFAEDSNFWRGSSDGIYSHFRAGRPLHGLIRKPTGTKDVEVNIGGSYELKWESVSTALRYLAVDVS